MTILSVITISYRDAPGLARTVRSLEPLAKSSIAWEHIVVDSSPEVNESSLPDGDWPLVHLVTPARGVYAAFNEGLRVAQGSLVWILNGGDRLRDLRVLERLVDRMNGPDAPDMICGAADLTRDGEYLYTHFPARSFRHSLLGANRICQQAVVYRRSALQRVGEFTTQYRIAGDYEHHLRCYLAGLQVDCCDDRLVEYDLEGLSTNWRLALTEFRDVLAQFHDRLPRAFYWQSLLGSQIEHARIWAVKGLANSPLASVLHPLWLSWHRRKNRRTDVMR
jgi:glycosyltransferase involved in cell wall biosynthesis